MRIPASIWKELDANIYSLISQKFSSQLRSLLSDELAIEFKLLLNLLGLRSPYVSGYLSPRLKLKDLKGEARGHEAKELFDRIQGISNQEDDATQSGICSEIM